jgi:hypothetical protein
MAPKDRAHSIPNEKKIPETLRSFSFFLFGATSVLMIQLPTITFHAYL